MNDPVVAINVYSVPSGKEQDFLTWWYDMKGAILDGSGLIRGKLHRSLEADAHFNFINVVEWENSLYGRLYDNSITPMKRELAEFGIQSTPAMFRVISNY